MKKQKLSPRDPNDPDLSFNTGDNTVMNSYKDIDSALNPNNTLA
jgi:hypothetical protein